MDRIPDRLEHARRIRENVVVPIPDNTDSCGLQRSRSRSVISSLLLMLTAVEFDGKLQFVTIEIEDEAFVADLDGMLTSKLQSFHRAVAQQVPDQLFGVGMRFAQITRVSE